MEPKIDILLAPVKWTWHTKGSQFQAKEPDLCPITFFSSGKYFLKLQSNVNL